MAKVTAAQKKTVTEPKVEASLEKKVVEQPVKKTTRTAAPKKVELAYVQFAGKESPPPRRWSWLTCSLPARSGTWLRL